MAEPEANALFGILKLFNVFSDQNGTSLTSQDLLPDSPNYNFIGYKPASSFIAVKHQFHNSCVMIWIYSSMAMALNRPKVFHRRSTHLSLINIR
jgi:hypothetical protein